jgi:hypothetical protein
MSSNSLNLYANKTFNFKGQIFTTGDIVTIIAKSLPVEVSAAFTNVDNEGNFNVFSTTLGVFQHSGIFSPEAIEQITILRSGEDAISSEARNPSLHYGEKARINIEGSDMVGEIIAAFNGVVCAWSQENGFLTGGSLKFTPV